MNCIIVEDEPYALDLLKAYVTKTPFLCLLEAFTNPFKALTYLLNNEVDLIFLDINMPDLSGIELLNSLPTTPLVIFTTAYPEFGAESYNYDAVDYLLKPINYGRFLKATNKAVDLHKPKTSHNPKISSIKKTVPIDEFILLKSGTKLHKVKINDILYVEGAGNYMSFHLIQAKKILSLSTMQEVLDLLPTKGFVRVHKSYVISLEHMDTLERHQVIIKGKTIPVGLTYREHFLQKSGRK